MSTVSEVPQARRRSTAITLNRATYHFSRNWLGWFLALAGLWVALPWLAPVFMRVGWERPAQVIYWFYSFQCHQLPQRSFFLFGPQPMLSLQAIQTIWEPTYDAQVLRQFIGSAAVGFKVA